MFQIYEPFNIRLGSKNDISLSDEEFEVINDIFLPKTKSLEAEHGLESHTPSFSHEFLFPKQKLMESLGRNKMFDKKPDLWEIDKAIKERKYVSIYYEHRNGEKGHRLIEPYAYGRGFVSPKGDIFNPHHVYIRAFVIMNTNSDKTTKGRFMKTKSVSVSDRRNRWRLFRLDRIHYWWTSNRIFSQYRRQYNPNDKGINNILLSLPHNKFPKGENPKINW